MQQPILDELDFSAYNAPQTGEKLLESGDDWQKDYSLLLEIYIGKDAKKQE